MTADRLERYADLALKVGVNLQPGQPWLLNAGVAHAPLVRVIADRAWRAGASTVFAYYNDLQLRKPLVDLAPDAALTVSGPGTVHMLEELVEQHAAFIKVVGDPAPDLLAHSDAARSGRAFQVDFTRRWGRPSARWMSAGNFTTAWGQPHVANLPTEEVFTSPDCRRTEGTIRSTRPLAVAGRVIKGLELTFKDGRITDVRADGGADALIRTQIATDPGAPYLGEIALVDKESRVGKAGIIFWNTLYDENATCHMAFGHGFDFT